MVWTTELKSCCSEIDLLVGRVNNQEEHEEAISSYL
jgi:hypothetical protein